MIMTYGKSFKMKNKIESTLFHDEKGRAAMQLFPAISKMIKLLIEQKNARLETLHLLRWSRTGIGFQHAYESSYQKYDNMELVSALNANHYHYLSLNDKAQTTQIEQVLCSLLSLNSFIPLEDKLKYIERSLSGLMYTWNSGKFSRSKTPELKKALSVLHQEYELTPRLVAVRYTDGGKKLILPLQNHDSSAVVASQEATSDEKEVYLMVGAKAKLSNDYIPLMQILLFGCAHQEHKFGMSFNDDILTDDQSRYWMTGKDSAETELGGVRYVNKDSTETKLIELGCISEAISNQWSSWKNIKSNKTNKSNAIIKSENKHTKWIHDQLNTFSCTDTQSLVQQLNLLALLADTHKSKQTNWIWNNQGLTFENNIVELNDFGALPPTLAKLFGLNVDQKKHDVNQSVLSMFNFATQLVPNTNKIMLTYVFGIEAGNTETTEQLAWKQLDNLMVMVLGDNMCQHLYKVGKYQQVQLFGNGNTIELRFEITVEENGHIICKTEDTPAKCDWLPIIQHRFLMINAQHRLLKFDVKQTLLKSFLMCHNPDVKTHLSNVLLEVIFTHEFERALQNNPNACFTDWVNCISYSDLHHDNIISLEYDYLLNDLLSISQNIQVLIDNDTQKNMSLYQWYKHGLDVFNTMKLQDMQIHSQGHRPSYLATIMFKKECNELKQKMATFQNVLSSFGM